MRRNVELIQCKEIMNIESVREYCLSLPLVTEALPFDERTLVFRILGKIFACVDLERPERCV